MVRAAGLGRLLAPGSIAVIGGREAEAAARQCDRLGFSGDLWTVNPKRTEMAGRPCYRSIEELPRPPDAAFVAIPREATVEVVAELAALGAGGAVCYASGFAEAGATELQERLVTVARDMPIIGPNTYGLVNAAAGVALWPDHHGCRPAERGAALVTQSSNIAMNLTMARPGFPATHVVAVGNQAGTGVADWVEALADQPGVAAIGIHMEWLGDGGAFGRAAGHARDRGVALVALKTGRSAAGADLNRSHTAALAGPDAAYDALFARYGVARVDTPAELAAALAILCGAGPLPGNRVASLSCSGGEASLVADLGERHRIAFPPPQGGHAAAVAATLDGMVPVTNPLDYHTFGWGDRVALEATFTSMLAGPYDAGLLLLDFPATSGGDDDAWWTAARAFSAAATATGTAGVVAATVPGTWPDGVDLGSVAVIGGLQEALAGIEAAVARPAPAGSHPVPDAAPGRVLDEAESKARLAAAGVTVPAGAVTDPAGAAAAAAALGNPVAVKALGVAHKTDAGVVHLDLAGGAAVAAAATALPGRVLVEKMIRDVVAELHVGATVVAGIGACLTLAAGGTLVELHRDAVHLLLPATGDEVRAALRQLRIWPLLAGHRGSPGADVDAAVATVMAVAGMVLDGAATEVEVNPLALLREGAVALDGRVVEPAP